MTNKIVSQMTLSLGNDTTIEIPIGGGIGGVASATGGSELIIKSIDEAGESRVRKYVLPVDEAEELLIFESGEEGSTESLVLSNGKAIGDYTIAAGQDEDGSVAIAGCKGFFYLSHFGTDVYLSLAQGREEWSDEAQALLDKWDGKKINIVGSHKHTMCSQVIAIAGNCIAVDKLPFGDQIPFDTDDDNKYKPVDWSTLTNPDWDDGAVYCPELPEAGVVRFGRGAKSIGAASVAAGTYSLAEGKQTLAANDYAHAEGRWTKAGYASHAEGYNTLAIGQGAHSEGHDTAASAHSSHAEGKASIASGAAAHAEGWGASASGEASHAEGYQSQSTGKYSHAEGGVSQASGNYSHSEGVRTKATKTGAHSEGELTEANGQYSHAEGKNTITNDLAGHVQGKYNLTTSGYAHVVGNGEANKPSDAHRLDWNGNAWFAGDITMKGDKKVASEEYVENTIAELVDSAPAALNTLNELAAALNDDANFATTMTTELSKKATKDELTAGLATKAPAGYGYGESPIYLGTGLDDAKLMNAITEQYAKLNNLDTMLVVWQDDNPDWRWFGQLTKSSNSYGSLVVHSAFGKGTMKMRTLYNGEWSGWVAFAPAGWGLAEETGMWVDDCDKATKNGWYKVNGQCDNIPVNSSCSLFTATYDASNLAQTLSTQDGYILKRVRFGGEWKPWEWENPPMLAGVEFRTTERWNSKPVYVKRISISSIVQTNTNDGGTKFMSVAWVNGSENAKPISSTGLMRHNNSYRPMPVHSYDNTGTPILTYDVETEVASDGKCYMFLFMLNDTFKYNEASAEIVIKYIKE